jgi:hypothetical protein
MEEILSALEKSNRDRVLENGLDIQYIKNPSETAQMMATSSNGMAINYIVNPSEDVQLNATSQIGYAIKYIESTANDVQHNAISINLIKNPCKII